MQAGIDVLLVGDSLGNVVQGHETTLPVTLDEMSTTRGSSRAARGARWWSPTCPSAPTRSRPKTALRSAVRCVKEGGAHAVKLEGGVAWPRRSSASCAAEIPVMGHVGLTPQAIHRMGGHRVQGRGERARARVLADARAVEAAGAFAVVLEGMPAELARGDHRERSRSRRSASARASTAMARCW